MLSAMPHRESGALPAQIKSEEVSIAPRESIPKAFIHDNYESSFISENYVNNHAEGSGRTRGTEGGGLFNGDAPQINGVPSWFSPAMMGSQKNGPKRFSYRSDET